MGEKARGWGSEKRVCVGGESTSQPASQPFSFLFPLSFSLYLSVSVFLYLYLCLSLSFYLCLSIFLSLSLSIFLSLSLSLSIFLSLSLSLSIFLSLSSSISLSLSLSLLSFYLCLSHCIFNAMARRYTCVPDAANVEKGTTVRRGDVRAGKYGGRAPPEV